MRNKKVARNPYTWTTVASMVFLEQPVGVGFSYTTDEQEAR
jgi:carboxypeptidase C (cathepsin A)